MMNPIGELLAADETFTHQVADTFAVVGPSDPSWAEKVCAMAMARDGSLQLGFGLGKYTNRNVMDSYAAVSRGAEQITVRASRRLSPGPAVTAIGPVHYEVVEPMKAIRFRLEPNDCQPLAFDWLFESVVPPFVEERTHLRSQYRTTAGIGSLPPDRCCLGMGPDRRHAHRYPPGDLGLDARPLVGRSLRRWRPAGRCGRRSCDDPAGCGIHDDLVSGALGTYRRFPVRHASALHAVRDVRPRPDVRYGGSRASRWPSRGDRRSPA